MFCSGYPVLSQGWKVSIFFTVLILENNKFEWTNKIYNIDQIIFRDGIHSPGYSVDLLSGICRKDNQLLLLAFKSCLRNYSWSQIVILQDESSTNGICSCL